LQIAPAVAGWLDAPGLEVILDVGGGQADTSGKYRPTLEFVRGDIGQPLLQVLRLDGCNVSARRRASIDDV
jgi:hypothetical protein